MLRLNSREPLMTEIIVSIVLFIISLLAMAGIVFKVIGSVIQFIATVLCYITALIERIKHKRADCITNKHDD